LKGSVQEVLFKFSANIPKMMGRGGASAERFKLRRIKARQLYMTNVRDIANHLFITDKSLNISEIVLCRTRDYFDDVDNVLLPEFFTYVKQLIEVSHGGEFGFNQAVRAMKTAKL
jgi:peptide subunit release factor 1 (eRF1)